MIAHGGMGAIYKARQTTLDRVVAIKLLPLEVSLDSNFAERFRREAQALAKVQHANIIAVYAFGQTTAGHSYIVTEYVDGASLHDWIHGSDLKMDDALHIFCEVCEGLACAHGNGVVHRDVKPGNVIVDRARRVKLLDFGLARVVEGRADTYRSMISNGSAVLGTPDYMSPEQKQHMNVDHRADVYSLGVMLYEMLCREVPRGIFQPASKRVGADPRLDAVIARAMNADPAKRFQSAREMKAAVESVRAGKARPSAPANLQRSPTPVVVDSGKGGSSVVSIAAAALVLLAGGYLVREATKSDRSAAPTPAPVSHSAPVSTPVPTQKPVAAKPAASGGKFLNPATGAIIDLLVRVKMDEDATGGKWQIVEGALVGELGEGAQQLAVGLPYRPPDQYDFNVEFTVPDEGDLQQIIAFTGGQGAWVLSAVANGKYFNGLAVIDGQSFGDRGEAAIPLTARLSAGKHTSKVQLRKGRIRVLVDGKTELDWEDDLARLSLDPLFKTRDPKQLALASSAKSITFHKIEVRELDEEGETLRPPVDRTAPMAPAAPVSEFMQWLTTTDETWKATFQREAAGPFEAGVAKLKEQYLAAVDANLTTLSKSGKIEEAVLFRDERVRFGLRDGVPDEDDAATPATLKQMRAAYRTQFAKLDKDRFDHSKLVHARYDLLLGQTQSALAQRQRLDDALLVKNKRAEIATAWLVPPAAAAAAAAKTPAFGSATAPSSVVKSAKLPIRELLQKLLPLATGVRIREANVKTAVAITKIFEVPPGNKIDLVSATFGPRTDLADLTDADLELLESCGSLENLTLSKLPITDATLQRLSACRELRMLALNSLPQVTAAGFASIAALPELQELDLDNLPVGDDGIKALGIPRKLTTIRLSQVPVTGESLAALAAMPALEDVTLGRLPQLPSTGWKALPMIRKLRAFAAHDPQIGAQALGFVGKCAGLESVNLGNSGVTDADVAPLAPLMKLRELWLANTKVSGTAFATWPTHSAMMHLRLTAAGPATDESLKAIANAFPKLEIFETSAEAGGVTAAGGVHLGKLRQLRTLKITGDGITDAIVAEIEKINGLTILHLGEAHLTEVGAITLGKMDRVTELELTSPPSTDGAIKAYQKMRALRTFTVGPDTPAAVTKKLQAALPAVTVR